MLQKLKHKLAIFTGKLLLNFEDNTGMTSGKRIVSLIAGAYIIQKGIRTLHSSPLIGTQEVFLGGFLLYNGAAGINLLSRKAKEPSEIRRNQIQGNDPDCIPAFV
jgi:uncharacterized membrane protein